MDYLEYFMALSNISQFDRSPRGVSEEGFVEFLGGFDIVRLFVLVAALICPKIGVQCYNLLRSACKTV